MHRMKGWKKLSTNKFVKEIQNALFLIFGIISDIAMSLKS